MSLRARDDAISIDEHCVGVGQTCLTAPVAGHSTASEFHRSCWGLAPPQGKCRATVGGDPVAVVDGLDELIGDLVELGGTMRDLLG